MIAVQASGCAPVVRAFEPASAPARCGRMPHTFAAGLRVPKPYGDSIMLEILKASGGMAMAVSDEEILASYPRLGTQRRHFSLARRSYSDRRI